MSELINNAASRKNFRWQLLSTVSALALLGAAYCASEVKAADDDSDRPTVWIELGGQLSRLDDGQEMFAPPLMAARPSMFAPSQEFEKPPPASIDEYGKVSFQPESSNWVFSASIRYGRSGSDKHVRQQTNPKVIVSYFGSGRYAKYPNAEKFADTLARNSEHHLIADFQAGKDVGLGMFGAGGGSSVFSLGVRFAQFGSNTNIALKSDPDWHRYYLYVNGTHPHVPVGSAYHTNAAAIQAARSFHGIGPSLSWNASQPFMGNGRDSELSFDWGLNAALLFGRQRASVHYQTTEQLHTAHEFYYHGTHYHNGLRRTVSHLNTNLPVRVRSVIVPNVGGFAGLSFRYTNAKVSFGYRGDFFIGAMDGGIGAARKEDVGFYGPFASVSVGIGG